MNDIDKLWADKLLDLRHEITTYGTFMIPTDIVTEKIDNLLKEINK